MFAPVIHTYGAISSVRNALCVYLWLQNPPDQGGLIFMGSVNRDFVFTVLQAGEQTHNSHMDSHTDQRGEGGGGGRQVMYCTGSNRQRDARAAAPRTHAHSDRLRTIWKTALHK